MTRFSRAIFLVPLFWALAACGAPPAPAPAAPVNPAVPRDSLAHIVDRYWDERVTSGNPLSAQYLADSLDLERRYLAELLTVPRGSLDADSQLTYDIFRRQRELGIEGFTYPSELLPVNPFASWPQEFARLAGDPGAQPFATAADYDSWLRRIDDYVAWTHQAIANMREGLRRGYTSPRVLIERSLAALQGLGADTSANVFYTPLRALPQSIKEPQRSRLSLELTQAVENRLLPAYRELHDFLQHEYLPRARTTVALTALPLGPSWYAYRVRRATDSSLTPDQIHALGVAEVERLRVRLQALSPGAAPKVAQATVTQTTVTQTEITRPADAPTADPSAGGAEPARSTQEFAARTLAAMPALFSDVPQAGAEFGAAGAGQTADLDMPGFLQEVLPGRRYQSALQQARGDLPKFRRFGSDAAFVDGWALYAESLGEELGLYPDEAAKRAALMAQLKCAAALVVDTGLHAQEWSRGQAVAYLSTQLGLAEPQAQWMTDRMIALPGDALACKMGELKIQALRSRAQQVLGARFDIREFHARILEDGAMPLDILEAKMRLWMEARR